MALWLALALPAGARAADERLAVSSPVAPAAAEPAERSGVSFAFLHAVPPTPAPAARRGMPALVEHVSAAVHKLSDPRASTRWGLSHGQLTFSFKTSGL